VLYENPDWLPPLVAGLESEGFDVDLIDVASGSIDPSSAPQDGIWLNRISPSSHTRGHQHTVQLTREFLFWLESHGRRTLNGLDAFELEMSKLRQDLVLRRHGILTPKTLLGVGHDQLRAIARRFDGPFITKHNQGGKGLGIELFRSHVAFDDHLASGAFDAGPDGKVVLQRYIEPAEPFITRVELVGGEFLYAMRSTTDQGFELCPSDACQLQADNCPADGSMPTTVAGSEFAPSPLTADDPLVRQLEAMCRSERLEMAGIEFVEDSEGNRYTYDINGTTNDSGVLGERIGVDGMREVARYLRTVVVPDLAVAA
jgi:hypothetical protein